MSRRQMVQIRTTNLDSGQVTTITLELDEASDVVTIHSVDPITGDLSVRCDVEISNAVERGREIYLPPQATA